jgi:Na+-transporting NADH:ubiquinone oxidoreductase subunit NqrB
MDAIIRSQDPRFYQVAVLGLLLVYGIVGLDFGIRWQNAAAIIVTAQLTQFVGSWLAGLPRFDPLSALISSLSLTLLLRTELAAIAALAAFIAIASKFLVRLHGKHVFNPANVALVVVTLSFDRAWLSSGQWGSAALGALALACLGLVVLSRARRAETTVAFLLAYALLVFGRAAWLGDPMSIPLHQLQNGALLIFAFFMISDPKTTPNSVIGRWLYGVSVAVLAYAIQFVLYEPNGAILALIISAPFVPLIDLLSKGERYRWKQPARAAGQLMKGA